MSGEATAQRAGAATMIPATPAEHARRMLKERFAKHSEPAVQRALFALLKLLFEKDKELKELKRERESERRGE
jgi:hypothetical protein